MRSITLPTWRKAWRAHARRLLGRLPSTIALWAGPSQLDGSPILLAAHTVRTSSKNRKTGDMLQLSIMRADVAPVDAWRAGADGAVCPDACAHRSRPRGGAGTCYVNKARLTAAHAAAVRELRAGRVGFPVGLFTGAQVRCGMEGDPAAVPLKVWARVLAGTKRHTGYTAAWASLPPEWAALFMASCATPAEAARAEAMGWRPFVASRSAADDVAYAAAGLRPCPADTVGLSCERCGGCDGTARGAKRRGYFLAMHGSLGAAARKRNDAAACPAAGAMVARMRAAQAEARTR